MKRQGRPQQQVLKKLAKRRKLKTKDEIKADPFQKRVFFNGAERVGGWIPMGNEFVRRCSHDA